MPVVADNTVAVDPSNRLLYIGETVAVSGTQTGGLRAFTISSSGVTPISGSPYSSQGTGPSSILPSADGNYVYVANEAVSGSSTDNIASFSVSTSSLTRSPRNGRPSGQIRLAEDSSGGYLLAVDFAGNPDLQIFTMSSGTLTSVFTGATTTQSAAAGPVAIAALP
jgi:DNA-binding beta-propeller fold protein YncE